MPAVQPPWPRPPLEIEPLRLTDPSHPAAIARVKEPGASLGDKSLARRGLGADTLHRGEGIEDGVGQGLSGSRPYRRLQGRGLGRRGGGRVELVDLEIGPDRRFELSTRLLEFPHRAAEGAAELGQVLGAEDEKRNHEDEDQFLETDVEHDGVRSYHPDLARSAGPRRCVRDRNGASRRRVVSPGLALSDGRIGLTIARQLMAPEDVFTYARQTFSRRYEAPR